MGELCTGLCRFSFHVMLGGFSCILQLSFTQWNREYIVIVMIASKRLYKATHHIIRMSCDIARGGTHKSAAGMCAYLPDLQHWQPAKPREDVMLSLYRYHTMRRATILTRPLVAEFGSKACHRALVSSIRVTSPSS